MEIKTIEYNVIHPYWKLLWPHMTPTAPVSVIDFLGIIDHKLLKFRPTYIAAYSGDKIVGVNSYVQTADDMYRTRGIWVNPENRKSGVGSLLLNYVSDVVDGRVWSMPRESALNFYIKNGFKQASELFTKYDFGPHCFVIKEINE
jgi:GNAT superfamily N-acetyltransferase